MTTYKIENVEAYEDLEIILSVITYHGSKHIESFQWQDIDDSYFLLELIQTVCGDDAGLEAISGDLTGKYFNAEIEEGSLVNFAKATANDSKEYIELHEKELAYKKQLLNK